MGDFNSTYVAVEKKQSPYRYKKSDGTVGKVDAFRPTQKLVDLKMTDTRRKRWGKDPLTAAQKKSLTTLNKKGATSALDYIFYRWKGPVRVANLKSRKDALYVSDHRKLSVTLWFQ